MGEFIPTKLTASNLLAMLFVYSKQLQLLDEELTRVKNDQNIMTCRDEFIESIWGVKLGQVFTSDFNITQYRNLLIALVKVALQDSTNQNIIDTVHAYFPTAEVDIVEYWKRPEDMVGYDWQNTSFKFMGAGGLLATEEVVRGDTSDDVLKGRVYSITRVGLTPTSTDYTEGVDYEIPANPNDYFIHWLGSGGDEPDEGQTYYVTYTCYEILGNVWNGNHPWIPDLGVLGFFLFGVQIYLRGINADELGQVEQYVIPALQRFVKPAGIYYEIIITDIEMLVAYKLKDESTRMIPLTDSILGFGMQPFGSPVSVGPSDFGFGSPSLPEYVL